MEHKELYQQYSDYMDKVNQHNQENPWAKMSEEEFLTTLAGVEISSPKDFEPWFNGHLSGFKLKSQNKLGIFLMNREGKTNVTFYEKNADGTTHEFEIGYLHPTAIYILRAEDGVTYLKSEPRLHDFDSWQQGDLPVLHNKCLREGLAAIASKEHYSVTEEDRRIALGKDEQEKEEILDEMFEQPSQEDVINALNTLASAGIVLSNEQKEMIANSKTSSNSLNKTM